MVSTKQLLTGFLILGVMGVSFVHANETQSSLSAPITTDKFKFTAVLDGERVNMKWNRFDSFSKESLQYYKVVHSSTNPKPVYPEDGYIKYDSDMWFTSFTDSNPKSWTNYYRICAITEKMNRYCSNIVTLNVTTISEGVKSEEKEWKKEKETKQDNKANKKIEALIAKFEAKLDELFGTDNTKKTTAINAAIKKLEILRDTKPHMATTINLVIEKLKGILSKTDYQDVEDILNIK
jgi:hypothetical protein